MNPEFIAQNPKQQCLSPVAQFFAVLVFFRRLSFLAVSKPASACKTTKHKICSEAEKVQPTIILEKPVFLCIITYQISFCLHFAVSDLWLPGLSANLVSLCLSYLPFVSSSVSLLLAAAVAFPIAAGQNLAAIGL